MLIISLSRKEADDFSEFSERNFYNLLRFKVSAL